MRKFLIVLFMLVLTSSATFAAKMPDNLQQFVGKTFPNTSFRFDGVVILPDQTVYLPLLPAVPVEVEQITIKTTVPANKTLAQKPDIIVFNTNYVLMKIITDSKGQKTLAAPDVLPNEVRCGLLPQDMLVPSGLKIPSNLKCILGNLDVEIAKAPPLRIDVPKSKDFEKVAPVEQLKNKTFYIATGYSKNIQVLNSESKSPSHVLAQKNVPNCIKAYDNLLLVTFFQNKIMNVISLLDEQLVKEIQFDSNPDEIIIDQDKKIAYVSSPEGASIYVVNLETMTLTKQIKVNGMCEKLTLSDDGTKMFYFDKNTNEIWAIELDNKYLLKDIGAFPNISKIAFNNNKIYLVSRTKNHLAIIDYDTNGLIAETQTAEKPIDLLSYQDKVFILCASENVVQVIDTKTDEITEAIYLNTGGFSSHINRIENTNLAMISDSKAATYSVLDMNTKRIIKVSRIDVPIRSIVVTKRLTK